MLDWTKRYTTIRVLYHLRRLWRGRRRRDPMAAEAAQRRTAFTEAIWREAAEAAGAGFASLGYGIFEIRQGDARFRVMEGCCALDDPVALAVAANKTLVYRLLENEGLPIPRYAVFTLREMERAHAFLERVGAPCVVKPANGSGGGQGVTTGVRLRSELAWAAMTAADGQGPELLIEEQRAGDNYRLLYLDGELLDAVLRRPPAVTGDGTSTIRKLVHAENVARLAHDPPRVVNLLRPDLDMHHTLAGQGLSLRSVPKAGQAVTLKTVINQNFGPENVAATHLLCDEVIEAGARAARCVGARLSGVDILTPDATVPLEQAGVVLEVNGTPGYHHHYHTKDGHYPVAIHVLARLLSEQAACRV